MKIHSKPTLVHNTSYSSASDWISNNNKNNNKRVSNTQ